MSWSCLVGMVDDKCTYCKLPIREGDEVGFLMFTEDIMTGEAAEAYSKAEEFEPPCSLLIGMDWTREYVFHRRCMDTIILNTMAPLD